MPLFWCCLRQIRSLLGPLSKCAAHNEQQTINNFVGEERISVSDLTLIQSEACPKWWLLQIKSKCSIATNVKWNSQMNLHWENILDNIQAKNRSVASFVTKHLHKEGLWVSMKELTPVRNLSAAPNVTTNAHNQVIWRDMKGSILVINHSAAHSVTTNAQD